MNAVATMTPPRRERSTPHQRLYVRTLMQQLSLDTSRTTLLHRRHFEAANLVPPENGCPVDDFLCALAKAEISALISVLKAEVSDDA